MAGPSLQCTCGYVVFTAHSPRSELTHSRAHRRATAPLGPQLELPDGSEGALGLAERVCTGPRAPFSREGRSSEDRPGLAPLSGRTLLCREREKDRVTMEEGRSCSLDVLECAGKTLLSPEEGDTEHTQPSSSDTPLPRTPGRWGGACTAALWAPLLLALLPGPHPPWPCHVCSWMRRFGWAG